MKILPSLLGQKYAYSNSNVCPLAEFFTILLDRRGEIQDILQAKACFFSTVHIFSMGFKSGLWGGHSKTSDVCLGSLFCLIHPSAHKTQFSGS